MAFSCLIGSMAFTYIINHKEVINIKIINRNHHLYYICVVLKY